jgi:hypothetical protein
MEAIMQDKHNWVLFSDKPKIQASLFNPFTGEITVCCDVQYRETVYKSLPVLRLSLNMNSGEVDVNDEYTTHLPYLKAIPKFRDYLDGRLRHFAQINRDRIVIGGIREYLEELRTYSDVKGLVRQAKSCVNAIRPDQFYAEQRARAVLDAMAEIPGTDVQIEFRDC